MLSYDVEDAEIVMAVFLHFCDTNFSLLVASEEHKFVYFSCYFRIFVVI